MNHDRWWSLHLARYREWQGEGNGFQGRLSSAFLREGPETPDEVEWIYVHEVWPPWSRGNSG